VHWLKPTSLPKNGGRKEREIPGSLYYLCMHMTSPVTPDDRFSLIFYNIIPLHGTNPTYILNNKLMNIKIIGGGRATAPLTLILK